MTRDLRLLAFAVFASAAGDLLALLTLAIVVHDTTASGPAVAGLFIAAFAPTVVAAPLAGRLADGVESVRLLVACALLSAAVATALAFATALAPILALTSLLCGLNAVGQTAEFALVPSVATDLVRANGVVESARYAGFAAGPLLAGAVVALGGTRLALLVNAATFAVMALATASLRARRPPVPRSEDPARGRGGLALLLGDRPLAVSAGANVVGLLFISALIAVEVFYVKDVLGAGDSAYALLTAVWMVAMVIGATGIAARLPRRRAPAVALVALAIQGAGVAGQTVWPVLAAAVAGYLIGGIAHGIKNTMVRVAIQDRVAAAAHGRAFAAYAAARNGAEVIALCAGGLMVAAIGPRDALVVAGVGPLVAGLVGLVLLRPPRGALNAGAVPATPPSP